MTPDDMIVLPATHPQLLKNSWIPLAFDGNRMLWSGKYCYCFVNHPRTMLIFIHWVTSAPRHIVEQRVNPYSFIDTTIFIGQSRSAAMRNVAYIYISFVLVSITIVDSMEKKEHVVSSIGCISILAIVFTSAITKVCQLCVFLV